MTDVPTPAPVPTGDARERLAVVRTEVAKAGVGQDAAVSGLLVALLCGGHVLMEGVPGVAKTLLVRTLAAALSVDTRRVQFTPDLMPGDITGSMVIDSHRGELSFEPVGAALDEYQRIHRPAPAGQRDAHLAAVGREPHGQPRRARVAADRQRQLLPGDRHGRLLALASQPVDHRGPLSSAGSVDHSTM